MKSIELMDEQYEVLVKLSFIGEWVLNAQHISPEFKEEQECVNYLFSNCKKFNLEKYFNKFGDEWEMKDETVLKIVPIIEEFTNNELLVLLITDLSERDAIEEVNLQNNHDIEEEEFEMLVEKYAKHYTNEFSQNGIANLRLRNVRNN